MLKRIAIVGNDSAAIGGLPEKLKSDLEVVAPQLREGLPANVVAVLGAPSDLDGVAKLAAIVGTQHEALLLLAADALDSREGLALGASARVAAHASRFAEALTLDTDETLTLERGALLRDVGKMRISNDVLLKKNLLSYDEWALIHSHTHIGADLVASLPGLEDLEQVVRFHHECYDGTGYPDKLEGDEIPLLARMMKILDVYCAMTSARHYRPTVSSHGAAIEHLRSEEGKHFDPVLVAAFIDHDVGRTDYRPAGPLGAASD